MEQFETFLREKKIDPDKFRLGMPSEWEHFLKQFQAESAKSFAARNRFLLNPLRMQYPLEPAD